MKNILLLLLALLALSSVAQPGLNIVWITAEDLSPRLSVYGDPLAHTPTLDMLADQGVTYTRAFSTYGVCSPSRHSIIMGMYPSTNGAGAMRTYKRTSAIKDITDPELLNIPVYEATPPPIAKCFTEYLRAAGYYCTNNVKTDYQFIEPGTAWDDNSVQGHWRNRPSGETPFFSVFNFMITHESMIHEHPSPEVINPDDIVVPPYYPDTKTVRTDIAHHYDNLTALDQQIATIIDQLKEDDLLDHTIIFFYGDHGDGLPRAKRWVYDSGIHIPLIIRFPDNEKAGTFNSDLVSFVDFAPTVLSLCNLPIPNHMEGQAFLGPASEEPREYIYAFRDRMDPAFETIRAVRDKRYKYIRNYRPELPYIGFIPYRDRMKMMQEINEMISAGTLGPDQWQFAAQSKPIEEFYDTEIDPHEIHNLACDSKYFTKMNELRNALKDFQATHTDLGLIPETELIKILWPPDGIQPTTLDPKFISSASQLIISCASDGASIAWRKKGEPSWKLYTSPLQMNNQKSIEAQAFRIGWKPSQIVEFD